MSATQFQSLYTTQFLDAVALLEDVGGVIYMSRSEQSCEPSTDLWLVQMQDPERCISIARYNLTDPTLPRYYRMKNLLLIASASQDWYEAERIRERVGRIWCDSNRLTDDNDGVGQSALREIRGALDQLKIYQVENAPKDINESLLTSGGDEDEDMDTVVQEAREREYYEDPEELAAADGAVLGTTVKDTATTEASIAGQYGRSQMKSLMEGSEATSTIATSKAAHTVVLEKSW